MRVDDRRDSICRVVKSIDKLKAKCDQQCNPQQHIGPHRWIVGSGKVGAQLETCIDDAASDRAAEHDHGDLAGTAAELLLHCARCELLHLWIGCCCTFHACTAPVPFREATSATVHKALTE